MHRKKIWETSDLSMNYNIFNIWISYFPCELNVKTQWHFEYFFLLAKNFHHTFNEF